jgi:hypothetical protein
MLYLEKDVVDFLYNEEILNNGRDMSYFDNITHSYTIVFQVQLYSPSYLSSPNPNGGQTEATMAATRSTWIPMGNKGGANGGSVNGGASTSNRQFKHGDTFTAYDYDAYYLKQNYVYNQVTNPNGVLVIVSETA